VHHPNVIQLFDVFEGESDWYVVTELAPGGELFESLVHHGSYSERQASLLLEQIASAVYHLHERGIAHADIKPENILLTAPDDIDGIKLVDFGLSTSGCAGPHQQKHMENEFTGTYAYWAPEQFERGEFGVRSDVWSIGVLMFTVLYGYHPFDPSGTASDEQLRANILSGNYAGDDRVRLSDHAKELLKKCLNPDPSKRVTSEELLNDEWFTITTAEATNNREEQAMDAKLVDSHQRLAKYHQLRRKLKGNLLSVIFESRSTLRKHPSAYDPATRKKDEAFIATLGTDETALGTTIKIFDPERKGYISSSDVQRVLPLTGEEAKDMLTTVERSPAEGLTYRDLAALLSSINHLTLKAGDVVFQEGDIDNGFYIVVAGELESTLRCRKTGKYIVDKIKRGDFFGEMELVLGSGHSDLKNVSGEIMNHIHMERLDSAEPRHLSVTCQSKSCELMRLSKEDFHNLTEESTVASKTLREAAMNKSKAILVSLISDAANDTKVRELAPGDVLYREGDSANSVCITKTGKFDITKTAEDGSQVFLKSMGEGNYLGEMAVLENRKRSATVACSLSSICKCSVLEVNKDVFFKMLDSRGMVESVNQVVSQRKEENRAAMSRSKSEDGGA
jgi:calcium/calmodulin-dependent protein kinase I